MTGYNLWTEVNCMSEKGIFVAIDGLDGSGKTVQVLQLTEYFRSAGMDVVPTREHWKEGVWGETIHQVVELKVRKSDKMATQIGFLADRVDHTAFIKPLLKRGAMVISDRYSEASINYSVGEARAPVIEITDILTRTGYILVPDLYILLDVPVEEAMKRLERRRVGEVNFRDFPKELIMELNSAEKFGQQSIFEKEEFLRGVRANYLERFSCSKDSTRVITDGVGTFEEVNERIKGEIQRRVLNDR